MMTPLLSIGLWSGRIGSDELLARIRSFLVAHGATVTQSFPNEFSALGYSPFSPDDEAVLVHTIQPKGDKGALAIVDFTVQALDDADWSQWSPTREAIMDLITAVRPALSTVSLEELPAYLPSPSWDNSYSLFMTGWVDLAQCDERQRAEFEELRGHGAIDELAGGVWWSMWSALETGKSSERLPNDQLRAALYHAWTGRDAPEPETAQEVPSYTEEDMAPREIWFWKKDYPADQLQQDVYASAHTLDLYTEIHWDDYEPKFHTVSCTYLPQGRSIAELVDNLRTILRSVHPDWAGVLHQTGFAPVGVVSDDGGRVDFIDHPWVDKNWIGDRLGELDQILAGCPREEIAGGILWITDPDVASDQEFTEPWHDHDQRFARVHRASILIGDAVRDSDGIPEQ